MKSCRSAVLAAHPASRVISPTDPRMCRSWHGSDGGCRGTFVPCRSSQNMYAMHVSGLRGEQPFVSVILLQR